MALENTQETTIDTHVKILVEQGKYLVSRVRFSEAAEKFSEAIKFNHVYADAHSNLGALYMDMGMNGLALPCLNKAIELNPNDKTAYLCRSFVKRILKDKDGAQMDLEVYFGLKK